jgi:hypothetical protein
MIDLLLDRLEQQGKTVEPKRLDDAAVVHLLEKAFEERDGRAIDEPWTGH